MKSCITTIRTLSMDAIQKANSGHPGTPMALAPLAFTLWDKFMKHNPANPDWANRDRFILSNGHASMLLYSLLHILGYDITLEDIENFRQLGSICAGHPEYGLTSGIETTTGPLGQGTANSVGFAIAEKWLAARFNKPGYNIIDYKVNVFVGDGDLMEGISSEAASIAGHLGLNNLTWFYDNNHITIEGETGLAFSEDVALRFKACNWNVFHIADANNTELIEKTINDSFKNQDKPSLIIVDCHIGYGAPTKQDSAAAHGSPLGEEEVKGAKIFYGCDPEKKFYVPDEVKKYTSQIKSKCKQKEDEWNSLFAKYSKEYPELAKEFLQIQSGEFPDGWESVLPVFNADAKGMSGRKAGEKALNALALKIPWLNWGFRRPCSFYINLNR